MSTVTLVGAGADSTTTEDGDKNEQEAVGQEIVGTGEETEFERDTDEVFPIVENDREQNQTAAEGQIESTGT